MKTSIFFVLALILCIGLITAQGNICVDFNAPSAPPNIAVVSSGMNLIITWSASTDIPSCSGIETYVILKDGTFLENTTALTYTNTNVSYGTYTYKIYAIDRAGHESNFSVISFTFSAPSNPNNGGGGGGGEVKNIITGEEPNIQPLNNNNQNQNNETNGETQQNSGLTGNVIGDIISFAATVPGIISLSFVIVVLSSMIVVLIRKRR